MHTKQVFVACDGQEFDSPADCREHETSLLIRGEVENFATNQKLTGRHHTALVNRIVEWEAHRAEYIMPTGLRDAVADVRTFMLACEQECPAGPVPANDQGRMYFDLIKEEFKELCDAWEAKDGVEVFDGALDLIWVAIGLMLSQGMPPVGGWGEVARSNMEKIDEATGKVNKREDGKVLKPEGWQPPNLQAILNGHALAIFGATLRERTDHAA